MNLLEICRMSNNEARIYLEMLRWPDGPVCPHCESKKCTRMNGKAHRRGALQCNKCRKQFTVTVNTVMESSKIPLLKWIAAFHLICSSKKGMSALQLQRELGLGSYRSAWFMCHRIRHALADGQLSKPMTGEIEADETYIGPRKPRYKGTSKRGRGTSKAPVMLLVERDGRSHAVPIVKPDAKSLRAEIKKHVDLTRSTLITDEWHSYNKIGKEFAGGHHTVNHGRKEYVRRTANGEVLVTTNTAESWFALLKRGHYGLYHMWSRKHLPRYCAEFCFRWNFRKVSDGERREEALRRISGKRLKYETPSTRR